MARRNWVFTINNPESQINVDLEQEPTVKYAVWQLEMGKEGTLHYQGYVEFTKMTTIDQVKSMGEEFARAHLEPRKGSREQARDYCMKEDSRVEGPWEHGDFKAGGQGARTDIIGLKKQIDEGKGLTEIWDSHPMEFLKYHKGIEKIMFEKQVFRDWMPDVYVVIGRTGAGKSSWCHQQAPLAHVKQRSKWWDGYDGQEDVILDDFYGWIQPDELLRLCDRYKMMVEKKGGQVQMLCKRIFINSNTFPSSWYKAWVSGALPFEAFVRRVKEWIYFDADREMCRFASFQEFKETCENDGFVTIPKVVETVNLE
ncbi:replication-associated protein [Wastewater CRESS DNA virus 2]|nr:replication-associated protein [Wastewater CRESS DNA virus 2]